MTNMPILPLLTIYEKLQWVYSGSTPFHVNLPRNLFFATSHRVGHPVQKILDLQLH